MLPAEFSLCILDLKTLTCMKDILDFACNEWSSTSLSSMLLYEGVLSHFWTLCCYKLRWDGVVQILTILTLPLPM